MELLCNAYSTTSDDEPEPDSEPKSKPVSRNPLFPPSKRPKPESSYPLMEHSSVSLPNQRYSNLRNEVPVAGRYVSKRERALSGAIVSTVLEQGQSQNPAGTTVPQPGISVILLLILFPVFWVANNAI